MKERWVGGWVDGLGDSIVLSKVPSKHHHEALGKVRKLQ